MNGCQRLSLMARFLRYTVRLGNCLIWTGARSAGGGRDKRSRGGPYGSFWINKDYGTVRAHVVMAWLEGRIPEPRVPEGQHLDHECHSGTLCVTCTGLKPKTVNLSLSRTRKPCEDARREAQEVARAVRIDRTRAASKATQERRRAKRGTR